MAMTDATEVLAREDPDHLFRAVSRFDPRLKSHNRPVEHVQEEVLPPDTPKDQFITKKR